MKRIECGVSRCFSPNPIGFSTLSSIGLSIGLVMNHCPACHEENALTARYCEACGAALAVPEGVLDSGVMTTQPIIQTGTQIVTQPITQTVFPNCQKCDSTDLESDGFCNQCGFRNPTTRDHFEQVINSDFVAISDRGIKHSQNEDCFAVQQLSDGRSILVVCDGVSSSSNPGVASQKASQAACRSIQQSLEAGIATHQAIRTAIATAQAVVAKLLPAGRGEPPSTTIVAAIVTPDRNSASNSASTLDANLEVEPDFAQGITQITRKTVRQTVDSTGDSTGDSTADRLNRPNHIQITLAWLGDSRAYWFSPQSEASEQLTQDHSWCEDMVATGQLSREEAERSIQAHAITRWLGADADDGMEPSLAQFSLALPGQLLLCSDGLWNYASDVSQLQKSLQQPEGTDLITIARKGVEFAKRCGGQDNITIALLDLKESPPPPSSGGT